MLNGNPDDDRIQISVEGKELSSYSVTQDISQSFFTFGSTYRIILLVLGAVFLVGIAAFVLKALDGFDQSQRHEWGYYSAMFAFLLMTAGSAPLVAVALRLTRNHWRRPLSRISELYAVIGLLSLLWFLPLLPLLPPIEGRKTLWIFDEFPGVPLWWDFFAVLGLVICGLSLLVVSAIPDISVVARQNDGSKARMLRRIAGFWRGTQAQWNYHQKALCALGAFYFMLLIFVHSIINVDFVMSLVPGWKDSILPAHQALTGLQAAIGSVLVAAFLVRTFGGYKQYIPMETFWSISKILLALSLLWGYFWFAALVTFWYGRMPVEQVILKTFMFESYRVPFLLNLFLSFLIPFGMLIWNPVRKSIIGPSIAGASVVIGAFFMAIRLYVPAFGIEDVTAHALQTVPLPIKPETSDIMIILGGIAGAALIYMLASKIIPIMSIWEVKEGLLYQRVRPFLRSRYLVLGKPE